MPRINRFAVCGSGFIGKGLVRQLISQGYMVNVLDRNICPEEFSEKTKWVAGEFADSDNLKNTLDGAEVAYHLISSTVPGDDTVDPIKELSENIFSTIAFLEMCKKCNVKRVVFVSSSAVYGLQPTTPISEGAETNPISSHGIQKLTIEKYLLLYQFLYGIDIRIIRLSNPYGPGQSLSGRQGFVAIAIGHMIKNEPVLLRDSGRPIRDFIYIDDVSRALALAGIVENAPHILNLGFGKGYSLKQVVELLKEITSNHVLTVSGELRKADIAESVLDISQAECALDFEPQFSIYAGLVKTLRYHGVHTPKVKIDI
jgi:UDP-glucose 4-epimerase